MKTSIGNFFEALERLRAKRAAGDAKPEVALERKEAALDVPAVPVRVAPEVKRDTAPHAEVPRADAMPLAAVAQLGEVAFYSAFNIDVTKRTDGDWVVRDRDRHCASVRQNPEEAILLLWRYVYKHGGVTRMGDISEQAEGSDTPGV